MEERFITTESAAKMRLRVGNNLVLTGTAAIWLQQLLLGGSRGRAALASMHVPVAGNLCGLLLGLLPVGYALWAEFLQKRVSRFGLYTLGHLAGVAAVLLLTPWAASRMLSLPFCLIILTASYYARINERLLIYPSPAALVPGLLLYLAAAFMGRTDLGITAFLGELCSGILLLFFRGQDSLETALDQIPKGGTVPYDRIRQAYARSMGKWVGIGAAAAGLMFLFHSGRRLFELAGSAVRALARLILRGVFYLLSLLHAGESAGQDSSSAAMPEPMEAGEPLPEGMQRFLDILWRVVTAAVVALAAWLIFLAVRAAVRSLMQRFAGARIRGTDKVEYYDVRERVKKAKSPVRERPGFFDRSPSAGIRRRYAVCLRRGPGAAKLRRSDTPRELERHAFPDRKGMWYGPAQNQRGAQETFRCAEIPSGTSYTPYTTRTGNAGAAEDAQESVELMHRLYEKARYSDETCTAEELAAVRQAAKLLERQV
ncbi:MAG: hypothetical protein MR607_09930 [Lachnospiraceae bacterium]|nr:hypothetical protein [Lachnospiraceae bacterium]